MPEGSLADRAILFTSTPLSTSSMDTLKTILDAYSYKADEMIITVGGYITITNTPMDTSLEISGTKSISGIESTDREFTFLIEACDEDGAAVDMEDVYPGVSFDEDYNDENAKTAGEGTFSMRINGLTVGMYYFLISEQQQDPLTEDLNWEYDSRKYIVKVEVELEEDSVTEILKPVAEVTGWRVYVEPPVGPPSSPEWSAYDNGTSIEFINTYDTPYRPILPETGGDGLRLFRFAGLAMIALSGAAVVAIRPRRRTKGT